MNEILFLDLDNSQSTLELANILSSLSLPKEMKIENDLRGRLLGVLKNRGMSRSIRSNQSFYIRFSSNV